MSRIQDKIKEIKKFLAELQTIIPKDFEKYKSDLKTKAACERYVEKIIEGIVDLAFLIIKNKKLRIPEEDIDAFNILLENKIIDENIAKKLKSAKGMRNIIAHQYGNIDDHIIFEAINNELSKDIDKFLKITLNL